MKKPLEKLLKHDIFSIDVLIHVQQVTVGALPCFTCQFSTNILSGCWWMQWLGFILVIHVSYARFLPLPGCSSVCREMGSAGSKPLWQDNQ